MKYYYIVLGVIILAFIYFIFFYKSPKQNVEKTVLKATDEKGILDLSKLSEVEKTKLFSDATKAGIVLPSMGRG